MRDLSPDYPKVPIWRTLFGWQPENRPLPLLTGAEDRFTKLSIKLQATRMAGSGFVELFEIVADFQRSRAKPVSRALRPGTVSVPVTATYA